MYARQSYGWAQISSVWFNWEREGTLSLELEEGALCSGQATIGIILAVLIFGTGETMGSYYMAVERKKQITHVKMLSIEAYLYTDK